MKDFKTIKFIDLFAGLGGIRIGLEQGFKELSLNTQCVFTSEIKQHALKAYQKNFQDSFIQGDITKIQTSSIPSFDILLAGFPCQPFSSAGVRRGFNDTRGTLFFEIERILKDKQPYAFILENVEGLLTHDKGRTLEIMLDSLNNLGYKVNYKLLDAKFFSLAQSRKRVYIVGTKDKLISLDDFKIVQSKFSDIQEHNKPLLHSDFTQKLLSHYSVDDLYGKLIQDKRGGITNIHSWDLGLKGEINKEQKELLELLLLERRKRKWSYVIGIKWMDGMPLTLEQIKTFYNKDNLQELLDDLVLKKYLVLEHPKDLVNGKRQYDESKPKGYNIVTGKFSFEFYKILDPNSVTPTLVAADVAKLAVVDGIGIRRLTTREGLRLCGFPDSYDLSMLKYTESFDLLGNTVCVPVIYEIAKRLAFSMKESYLLQEI